MNRQQRRAAQTATRKLPAHRLNRLQQKPTPKALALYAAAQSRATEADDPPTPLDDRERVWQENEAVIKDIVYCRRLPESIAHMVKFARNSMILCEFYSDTPAETAPFREAAEQSCAALNTEHTLRDGSPNQRRALLAPLQRLNDLIYWLLEIVPGSLLFQVARYGTGIQLRHAYTAFYEQDEAVRQSTVRIIRGESLRSLAKEYGIKEPDLRAKVLYAAKYLYSLGECFNDTEGITPAHTVPDLRTPEWLPLGDCGNLRSAAELGKSITDDFETRYGISNTLELAKRERALAARLAKKH